MLEEWSASQNMFAVVFFSRIFFSEEKVRKRLLPVRVWDSVDKDDGRDTYSRNCLS